MVNHKQVYCKHFGYGEQDTILCENCGRRFSHVHHLVFRSQGGTDDIENLMGLCHICHEKAHVYPDFNEELKVIHLNYLNQ